MKNMHKDSLDLHYELKCLPAKKLADNFKNELQATGLQWQDFVPEKNLQRTELNMPIEAYENNFIVCSAKDVNDISTYTLIDGFNRLIVNDVPDIDIFVKVYHQLSLSETIKLYNKMNSWKLNYIQGNSFDRAQHFLTRGFAYFLYKVFDFKPLLKEYVAFFYLESSHMSNMIESKYFYNDLRTLVMSYRNDMFDCMHCCIDHEIKNYRRKESKEYLKNVDLSWETLQKFFSYPEIKNITDKIKKSKSDNLKHDLKRDLSKAFSDYVLKNSFDDRLKITLNNDTILKSLVKITDSNYFKNDESLLRGEAELYLVTKNGANTVVEKVEYVGIKRQPRGGLTVFNNDYYNFHVFNANGKQKYRIIVEETLNHLHVSKNKNNKIYLAKKKKG